MAFLGFYLVLSAYELIVFYLVLLGFTGFYWVSGKLDTVFPANRVILCVLPSFTGLLIISSVLRLFQT